jgi:hypothetical protein
LNVVKAEESKPYAVTVKKEDGRVSVETRLDSFFAVMV